MNADRNSRSRRGRASGKRDAIAIALVVVAVFSFGAAFNLFDSVDRFLQRSSPIAPDDILAIASLIALGFAVYGFRRGRQLTKETHLRRETEERFRSLVEEVPAMTYTWDTRRPAGETPPVYVSPQIEAILGYTVEEWRENPKAWLDHIHDGDRDRVIRSSEESDRTGLPFREEYRIRRKDGRFVWIYDESVTVEKDASGRPVRAQGVMYDVTARKEAELRLQEAENRYRTIVERVPAVAYVWDAAFDPGTAPPPYISPQIERLLGYSAEAWLADPAMWSSCANPDDAPAILERWNEAVAAKAPFVGEYRMTAADGREVWVRDESVPVGEGPTGAPLYQGVMFDITDAKRAEEQLRTTEERYRLLVEHLPVVTYVSAAWVDDEPRSPRYVAPGIEDLLGYTVEEWIGDPLIWDRALNPDDRDAVFHETERCAAAGLPFDMEYRLARKDGRTVWVRDQAAIVERGEGTWGNIWQGVFQDVTARKEAEEREAAARDRFQNLVERLPVVVYTSSGMDEPGLRYVAPGIEELTGHSSDEWLADAQLWERLLHPDDRERVLAESRRTDETGDPFDVEYRMVRPDGRVVWVRDTAAVVERSDAGRNVWQGVFQDVTRRKAAENLLRDAESQFRTLVEQIPAITYAEDPATGENIYISPQIESMFGFTAEEWMADPDLWATRLHPDDRDWVVRENAADTGDAWSVDYRTYTRDGTLIWVHNEAVLIRDEDGTPRFWQGVVSDITERKVAEERLRAAEGRYRTLVEQLPAVVYVDAVDDTSTALYISPQYEQLLGYTAEERMADPGMWVRLLHPDDRDRVTAESLRTNETGDPFDIEYRLVRKDGGVVWVHDYALLVKGEGRGEWQGVLTDITERKLAFEDLSRRDRILEAAGFAAERFLHAQAYYDVIDEVLERLGVVMGASRAYLFQNEHDAAGNLLSSQRFEWAAEGVTRTLGQSVNQNFPYRDGFGRWERVLGAGEVVHGLVRDFPSEERPHLDGEDILSLCVMPVSVAGTWWGFVGFDQCNHEREWQPSEIDALRVVASTLGAAIGREHAERKLSETEARYRTLVEQIPAITYMVDANSKRMVYISPQLESVLGYTRDEWGPTSYRDTLHPDDRERVLAIDARTDETGEPYRVEFRQRSKDGRWVWIRDEAVLIRDERGNPLYWQGVRFDVTAQKEAEQHLREAEARYRTLVEQMPAVTYIDGPADDPGTKWVSPQITELLGFTPDEWIDEGKWKACIHPDDRDEIVGADLAADATGEPFNQEYRMVHRDGHAVWVLDQAVAIRDDDGRHRYWQGVYFDITAQKEAEQALHAAEERYRTLVETIPAATYIDTVEDISKAIYMSPQVEEIFGYSPEEWANDPGLWEQGLHPDDHDGVVARVEDLNRRGAPYAAEYRFRRKDGSWKWIRDQAVLISDEQGAPLFTQGFMFDITDRMEAIEQLREAEERFRGIVEHVPAAIYVDVPDGSMETTYVSPQIEAIWGLPPEQYLADPNIWLDMMDPQDQRAAMHESYTRSIEEHTSWEAEYRIRRADGSLVWVHDETTFVHDEDGRPIFLQGVMYDVTERKLAEEALRASEQREREAAERLRALDEMKNTFLAAVSHELRSPLTSILGLSLTLERQDALPAEDRTDLLDRLAANARKLDRLLKDLLDIDRLNRGIVSPQYRVTDVGALARRTVESLDSLAERTIVAETDPVVIMVDPAKVERIVENLLVNAARHTGSEHTIWLRVHAEDGGVLIAVDDDGPGVPTELREAIFEPFRQGPTASKATPGTGIGLSLVARFAELHGGRAWVEDREGGGASFRVFLPSGPGNAPAAVGGNGRHANDPELADAG